MARSIKRAASWAAPQFLALFRQLDRLRAAAVSLPIVVCGRRKSGRCRSIFARVTACNSAFFSRVRRGLIPMIVRLRISCRLDEVQCTVPARDPLIDACRLVRLVCSSHDVGELDEVGRSNLSF
jgi:hypothetical protein